MWYDDDGEDSCLEVICVCCVFIVYMSCCACCDKDRDDYFMF
jgi:hypothetical protein